MTKVHELRYRKLELRAEAAGRMVSGYAALFNSPAALDVDLYDVSAVTFPAYGNTSVSVEQNSARGLGILLPGGPPASAPMELRTRISQAVRMTSEELAERQRAGTQARRLLDGLAGAD